MEPVTVDASVFVRATNPQEQGSDVCVAVIDALGSGTTAIILPTFVLAELAGVFGSRSVQKTDIDRLLERISGMPRLTFQPLDRALAEEAAEIAMSARLQGADSIYLAAARRYGATLITADEQQRTRAPQGIATITPEAAIVRLAD
ncbi:MAG: PIN domain-containing protein [Armatimonadetes bacterium]|nr:PIN domain-containing protein [Armatimonadota bacterium]